MHAAIAPTRPTERTALSGLARTLVQHRLLRADHAIAVQQRADESHALFIDELIGSGALSARAVAQFAAETFGYPLLDLASLDASSLQDDLVDRKLAGETRVVALGRRAGRLCVAISDPTDQHSLDRIKFQTQSPVDPIVVEHDKLVKLVDRINRSASEQLADLVGESIELEFSSAGDAAAATSAPEVDDAPVVRFLQKVLLDAIQDGASDVHFEPYERFYRIRVRVDGELREVARPPVAIKEKLASRIKVVSRLDIAERRVPQDGRMKLALGPNRTIDFRVSTLPTLFGEKIVMRILDSQSARLGIEALGYEPDQQKLLLDAIRRPYGMILVTGPTGSGKTVSLYACLNILNQAGVNISTAEDPAEINVPGINQVNVNEKAGLTFAAALRSFLRQDPDVIMVGEVRDLETADIAVKAAQTGHLMLSTLHTNDAPATLTRLLNMGVAPFNVASSVILITAQRLARKLCSCKEPVELDPTALLQAGFVEDDLDGRWQPFRAVGCERCGGSGYKGRTGIYQTMPITEAMQSLILANGNAIQIAELARREGVRDLRRSGLLKVKQGVTSIEEVLGVTNE